MKFANRGFIGMCMALVLTFTSAIPAFAAEDSEVPEVSNSTVVTLGESEGSDVTDSEPVPYGSLAGHKKVDAPAMSFIGHFVVDVNGSWSPIAGCTLKTEGFSPNATIEISVCYGDDVKCTKILGPNTEVKNIPMYNVSPGGYTVKCTVRDNSAAGTVEIWIY